MRRSVAFWTALFLALGGWVAIAASLAEPHRAAAQTQSPSPVVIERAQDAAYLPGAPGKDVIAIVAIGSDARPGQPAEEHLADSLHLITVNPKENAATILGFPRDSFVEIPGVGTRKINEALFYGGAERVAETIASLTGVEVDYYLLTAFEGFKRMVGGIGGLQVDVPYPMNDAASGAVFEAGVQELDGAQALAFSRNRKSTPNGDFSRSENQGLVLAAAQTKLRDAFFANPTTLFQWIAIGMQNVQTDLSIQELFELGVTAASVDPAKVTNLVVPGGTGSAGEASVVFISEAAQAIYQDLQDDGILNR